MYTVANVHMTQQVRNFNCGRNALEALLRWRHGSRFGKKPVAGSQRPQPRTHGAGMAKTMQFGPLRTQHSSAAREHINDARAYGFDPADYMNDYGLAHVALPGTAQGWEDDLREYGPIIVPGCIGAVEVLKRFGAGHHVLVIGIDTQTDELIYLDSLGSVVGGGLAFFGLRKRDADQQLRMSRASFANKIQGHNLVVSCKPR
jgi:hypothetical protein